MGKIIFGIGVGVAVIVYSKIVYTIGEREGKGKAYKVIYEELMKKIEVDDKTK